MPRRAPLSLLLALFTLVAALPAAAAAKKAPHDGWPKIDGDLIMHKHDENAPITATKLDKHNELLGGNGSDTITGGNVGDVIWGDYKPHPNTAAQHDVLIGGGGKDFIYSSHGANDIDAGPGDDVIHAHFGTGGTITCGDGRDLVYFSHRSRPHFRIHGCERISYRSFGS